MMHTFVRVLVVVALLLGWVAASAEPGRSTEAECNTCHFDEPGTQRQHYINHDDDCSFCHRVIDPLGTHEVTTVRDNYTCLSCHSEMDLAAQQSDAHLELQCGTCHRAHSSDNQHLLSEQTVQLCMENCHTTGDLGLSHPVGRGTIDKTTNSEMTCTSTCHSVHDPQEPKLLQLASTDLCYQCHADKF